MPAEIDPSPTAYLLPAYDEYTVAYKDSSAVLTPECASLPNYGHGIINPPIVIDGQVVATWKRELKKDSIAISTSSFAKLKRAETRAIADAANRYGKFLALQLYCREEISGGNMLKLKIHFVTVW